MCMKKTSLNMILKIFLFFKVFEPGDSYKKHDVNNVALKYTFSDSTLEWKKQFQNVHYHYKSA